MKAAGGLKAGMNVRRVGGNTIKMVFDMVRRKQELVTCG